MDYSVSAEPIATASGSMPRVALYSRRRAEMRVWQAAQYEFEDVILACEDAVLVAPEVRRTGDVAKSVHGLLNRTRRSVGLPRKALLRPVREAFDSELFVAVFAAPHEIGALPHVQSALERAEKKVAFIVEMYRPDLPAARDYLRQLRGFDHVFVFTRDVIPTVEEVTGVQTSFLATGVDAAVFTPPLLVPARTTAVLSYGRRIVPTHRALYEAFRRGEFHYSYDTVRGRFDVNDHAEHRAQLAANLHRTRYVVIHRNNDDAERARRTGGEETLSNRLFEATAAGAIILGSAPRTPDFTRYFGWPDAVVQVPDDPSLIPAFMRELDDQPARLARASRAGILAGLRDLDWGYRWKEMLDAVGMQHHPALARRFSQLEDRACLWELDDAAPPIPTITPDA